MTTPATYHTPAGWAERCTMRDDTAAHQVRIHREPQSPRLYVTCTCQPTIHSKYGSPHVKPIAIITTAEEALRIWRKHHQEMTA